MNKDLILKKSYLFSTKIIFYMCFKQMILKIFVNQSNNRKISFCLDIYQDIVEINDLK